MTNYDVYFELYGKKMKAVIMANSQEEAKEILRDKVVFHKVVKSKDEFNDAIEIIDQMMDILSSKK